MEHHAQLWLGSSLQAAQIPPAYLTPSVDVVHMILPSLGIEAVRELQVTAARVPVAAPVRVFVICVGEITHEAQNALLKILEEPPQTTRFLLVVPHERSLLGTVRSRLQLMNQPESVSTPEYDAFVNATYADRLEQVAAAAKSKQTEWFAAVIAGLEASSTIGALEASALHSVQFVLERFKTRGSSSKLLFELLALTLPVGGPGTK